MAKPEFIDFIAPYAEEIYKLQEKCLQTEKDKRFEVFLNGLSDNLILVSGSDDDDISLPINILAGVVMASFPIGNNPALTEEEIAKYAKTAQIFIAHENLRRLGIIEYKYPKSLDDQTLFAHVTEKGKILGDYRFRNNPVVH